MLMMQKRVAGCGRQQAQVAASSAITPAMVRKGGRRAAGIAAAPANLSSFMNAGALKVKVALGNARMSRTIGGGAKAFKRCVAHSVSPPCMLRPSGRGVVPATMHARRACLAWTRGPDTTPCAQPLTPAPPPACTPAPA